MGVAVLALGAAVLVVANGGLSRIATAVGSSFSGFVTDLTRTPEPSATEFDVADPPTRIYVAIGEGNPDVAIEVPVGASQHFLVPGLTLSPGVNTFTATILGPTDLESEASAAVTYVLDTTKPKITISAPKANAVVNSASAQVVGQTQARSTISLHNLTTNATVAGAADAKGAFSVAVPIGTGSNKIQVTATDPAGNANVATVTVRRGNGVLTANVSASFYQLKLSKLPEPVQLTVTVTDPDGRALAGAKVTFTLTVPSVPAIASSTLTTSSSGRASFTTTIPKGATAGQCSITVIVHTTDLGDTTDRTVITLQK
jgi:hypothetical protein